MKKIEKKKKEKIQQQDKYQEIHIKNRKAIFIDNLIGGISWGLGSVIGATIIVGILGLIIVNTKKIPFVGEIIEIVTEQIESGLDELKDSNK